MIKTKDVELVDNKGILYILKDIPYEEEKDDEGEWEFINLGDLLQADKSRPMSQYIDKLSQDIINKFNKRIEKKNLIEYLAQYNVLSDTLSVD